MSDHQLIIGIDGIEALAAGMETDVVTLLSRVSRIAHGTTVATNALLTRQGDRVGLIATAGLAVGP
jgi:N-methylhydantoinase A